MIKLTLDKDLCVGCGDCEILLPNLASRLHKGSLLINERNPVVNIQAVHRAVGGCLFEALTLETICAVPAA